MIHCIERKHLSLLDYAVGRYENYWLSVIDTQHWYKKVHPLLELTFIKWNMIINQGANYGAN